MIPTSKHKRPSLCWGAAFVLGALLGQGCASVVQREPEVMQMQLGQTESALASAERPKVSRGNLLKVLIRRGQQGLKLAATGGLGLFNAESGEALASIPASGKGRLEADQGLLILAGRKLGAEAEVRAEAGDLRVAGRRYNGRIVLRALDSQVVLINEVNLEDYLKGVLPSEVPASWPLDALKAQAVAARSYAVWRVSETRRAGNSPYDLDDSVASQVYQGREKQEARTDAAVDDCRGELLSFRGKVAQCFFHSNSGGHTAGSDEAWGTNPAPSYLAGVEDSWSEDQKHYAWTTTLSVEEVERRLRKASLWPGGILEEVLPKDRTDSGRWNLVRLLGHGVEKTVKATALRTALGADLLRSTNFRVRPRGSDLVFDGLGWGHGVGLAQEGAKAMADSGKNYRYILDYYYPGTRWARLR